MSYRFNVKLIHESPSIRQRDFPNVSDILVWENMLVLYVGDELMSKIVPIRKIDYLEIEGRLEDWLNEN